MQSFNLVDLLKAGNYDRIKDLVDKAMKVGVDSEMGHDYLLDFDERTEEVSIEIPFQLVGIVLMN